MLASLDDNFARLTAEGIDGAAAAVLALMLTTSGDATVIDYI